MTQNKRFLPGVGSTLSAVKIHLHSPHVPFLLRRPLHVPITESRFKVLFSWLIFTVFLKNNFPPYWHVTMPSSLCQNSTLVIHSPKSCNVLWRAVMNFKVPFLSCWIVCVHENSHEISQKYGNRGWERQVNVPPQPLAGEKKTWLATGTKIFYLATWYCT